jgi:hypothetical protein
MGCREAQMIEAASSTQGSRRRLHRPTLSTVATKTNGRAAAPTLGALAGSVLVNLTKDQLRVAPVYKAAEPVVMIGGPDAKP